jgi:hypothetical protein
MGRMMNQTIPARAIRAVALFAAKDMGRYAFHGISVEHGRMIATDGRRLAVVEWEPAEGDVEPEGKAIILPVAELLAAAKVKGCERVIVNGTLKAQRKQSKYSSTFVDGPEFPYRAVEGEFPDWRAALPKPTEALKAEPVRLAAGFLADCGKAGEWLADGESANVVQVEFHGHDRAAEFRAKGSGIEFHAVVMPITGPSA